MDQFGCQSNPNTDEPTECCFCQSGCCPDCQHMPKSWHIRNFQLVAIIAGVIGFIACSIAGSVILVQARDDI